MTTKKPPKPTPSERTPKPDIVSTGPIEPLTQLWRCEVCGGLTDLVVCPVDGNTAPGVKLG